LLGSESKVRRVQDEVRGELGGLTLDWLPIAADWKCSGVSIADTKIFDETAVVIVAVMRHGEPIPTPDGNFRLRAGDVAIVVGAPEGIELAQDLLQRGVLRMKCARAKTDSVLALTIKYARTFAQPITSPTSPRFLSSWVWWLSGYRCWLGWP
jgi:NhaP-type Na+/H+ and K+/H+ antiporter